MEAGKCEEEVETGLALLGHIMQKLSPFATTYEPTYDRSEVHCFISSSFDGTSHFGSDVDDLLLLHNRVAGKELDMTINTDSVEADN